MVAPRARDVVGGGDLVLGEARHLAVEGREIVHKGLVRVRVRVRVRVGLGGLGSGWDAAAEQRACVWSL